MGSKRIKNDPLLADDELEQEYTMTIRLTVGGFGRREHQLKQVSEIRRVVEVANHGPVEMHVYDRATMSWEPAERLDRNAKQKRGDDTTDEQELGAP